jgi:hypothetical protein
MEIINSMVLDIGKIILMVTATGNMKKQNDIQKEWLSYEGCKEEEKVKKKEGKTSSCGTSYHLL